VPLSADHLKLIAQLGPPLRVYDLGAPGRMVVKPCGTGMDSSDGHCERVAWVRHGGRRLTAWPLPCPVWVFATRPGGLLCRWVIGIIGTMRLDGTAM